MKAIFLVIGLVVGLVPGIVMGAIVMHFLDKPLFGEPRINFQTIYFPPAKTEIYTIAHRWGLTDDHEEVRLCPRPYAFGGTDQSSECAVFHTARIFYKKVGPNGLQIYAPSYSISPDIRSSVGQIRIGVKPLKNFDEIRDFEQNFENYGLMTIAAP